MSPESEGCLHRYKWYLIISLVVALPIAWMISGDPGTGSGGAAGPGGPSTAWRWMLRLSQAMSVVLLTAVVVFLSRVCKVIDTLSRSSDKLEEVTGSLQRIGDRLEEICQSTRLSETAKAIAFRDAERTSLQEAVLQKLKIRDYEAAYELIDEIGRRPDYRDLADQIRAQVDQHRQAIWDERIEPVITQIESLMDGFQWSKASVQIEGLIKACPYSERARSMRQVLHNRKEDKKRTLLSAWDEAVKHQDTDRSLVVLKELDLYLTPNEALALQEAAKDVFRNKLHNLGVRFSMAVSDRNWSEALDVGQQIIEDFPNSRMSEEIRGKLDVLRQNVQLSA